MKQAGDTLRSSTLSTPVTDVSDATCHMGEDAIGFSLTRIQSAESHIILEDEFIIREST